MPASSAIPHHAFQRLVAARFADRPSLRGVIAKEGFTVLAGRYPWILQNYPQLQSIDDFTVLSATEPGNPARQRPLVDILLEHVLSGERLSLAPTDQLSLAPPRIFHPQEQGPGDNPPQISLNMVHLNNDFDDLLSTLIESFQQAQISFWNGSDATSDVSPLRWLQQTLKAALLSNVQRQGLSEDEKSVLYALLDGTGDGLTVNALQVTFDEPSPGHSRTLPDLLITAKREQRSLVLWCQPSGVVRRYDGLSAFAIDLRDALAEHYRFDTLSWAHSPVAEDPFAYQAGQVLNGLLGNIGRLRLEPIASVSQLEAILSALSDPSCSFVDQADEACAATAVQLPEWLAQASVSDRFQYQQALLELSASQALSQGKTSLDGIDSLQGYTARRLREQMRADHPGQPPYDPDQLFISISVAVEVSSSGFTQLRYDRTLTLTELAISRLHTSDHEVMTRIDDASGSLINDWMNLDYVGSLIAAVDVGGLYPRYVHDQLADPVQTSQRSQRFSREWRSALLLSALQAKIEGHLEERAWQALADFCRSTEYPSEHVNMAPLAFLCAPGASSSNAVHSMFLIRIQATQTWILYRPLYTERPILPFSTLEQLMADIQAPGELQQSMLDWLDDDTRPVYANGGFARPHLHTGLSELAPLLGTNSALAEAILQKIEPSASVAAPAWSDALDSRMFQARIDTLLLLASRQSVSNAQQRWAMMVQFGWLLFNTVTPLLRGPVGSVFWLIATLVSLKDDLALLSEGTGEEKLMAAVDLLGNLALSLVHHVGGEGHQPAVPTASPEGAHFEGPAPRAQDTWVTSEKPRTMTWEAHAAEGIRVTRWSDNQRLGNLSAQARQTLDSLRTSVSLDGLILEPKGRLRGLYKRAEQYYVKLQDTAYEVYETWNGVRIVGPDESHGEWQTQWGGEWDGYYIVGRERRQGPWLTRWNGEWMIDLHMAGGMPKGRQMIARSNQQAFEALHKARDENDIELRKLETLSTSNALATKAYDDAAKAFRTEYEALPDAMRNPLSEAMLEKFQAVDDLRKSALPNLRMLTLTYERQATLIKTNIELFTQMCEPRFALFDRSSLASHGRGQWIEQAINNDMYLFHRLLELTDYSTLKRQSRRLLSLPPGEDKVALYAAHRENLTIALQTHRRIRIASERLDENITVALNDATVLYKNKDIKLKQVIGQRTYSTLIVRAQIISDLSQLALNNEALPPEKTDELIRSLADLGPRELQQAVWSHDGLAAAKLPPAEQADVLNTALRQYTLSLAKADFLRSLNEPGLDAATLEQYMQELSALKSMAERDLSSALHDWDTGTSPAVRQITHRVRPGKAKLIHTAKGQAILAVQQHESDIAIQHDPINHEPVNTYQQQGDHWVEIADKLQGPQRSVATLRRMAEDLLVRKDAKIALASRSYPREPNSLKDILEWHIEDMGDIASQLESATEDVKDLASRLREAIAQMQAEKQRLLTSAYLDTRHPDSKALRFLFEADQIDITQSQPRKRLKDNDYLDVYRVNRKVPQQKLWEVHFHYNSADAAPRAFAKGHLKFSEPHAMSRDEQLMLSNTPAERLRIYRGDLRLDQIEGVIPFPAT